VRALQTTLFVIVLLVLSTQTFRHVYVRWFEPTASVLDEFLDPVENEISESEDLAELRTLYAKAHAARAESEAGKPLSVVDLERRTDRPVYAEEREIREAIERLEEQGRSISRLWFYWLCGLGSIVVGLVAYARVDRWLGMAGIIAGFVEMAVWTSPLWRARGPQGAFEHLLALKLALSATSMALLVSLWLWSARSRRSNPPSALETAT
jgi:hypothetical protein